MNVSEKARIAYTGPALGNGAMDIRELAPSLLAFAELIEKANEALGKEQKIQVLLNQDSFQKGSFDITTILQCSLLEQAKLFMTAADENGLSDLMTVLGWGGITVGGVVTGIFSLIKLIRGRKIKKAEKEETKIKLYLEDSEIIVTTDNTMKVFVHADCRKAIEKVMKPLETEGIDSFELRNPKNPEDRRPLESIGKKDKEYFKAPPIAAQEKKERFPEQEITVKITAVTFEKKNKWRLTDGNNTFWAKIEDMDFLDKVEKGLISFTNGDMLRIRYYIQQTVQNDTLSSEYIVTNVLEFKKRPEQIALDFEIK